ncbi:MAG TPA: type II toxin-antitoxin system RelE/ParE family toxin [Pyrinomonadaceae bacterium]|jgi:proteic killer suppression protein
MIRTFRHKGLTQVFEASGSHAVAAALTRRLIRQLDYLNRAATPQDMNLPGYRLHELRDERKDMWGVAVTDVCRLTFTFEGSDAFDVDLEDNH